MNKVTSLNSYPESSKMLDEIAACIKRAMNAELLYRAEEIGNLVVNIKGKFRFSITARPEDRSHSSMTARPGTQEWNGRWRFELKESSVIGPHMRTWRPTKEKVDETIDKIVDQISQHIAKKTSHLRLVK